MRNRELANDSITHPMLDPGCAESTVVFIPCLLHTAFLIRFIVRAASNVIIETRRFGGSRGLYFQYICLKTFCGGGGGVFFLLHMVLSLCVKWRAIWTISSAAVN